MRRSGRLSGPVILLAFLAGCSATAPRSSLYPSPGNSAPGDGKATIRIDVKPLRAVSPVGSEQVVIATITDGSSAARRRRRVEWHLDGVGTIVAVDDTGILIAKGHKVDDHSAISYAEPSSRRVERHTGNPADDIILGPGQTWCLISAPVEGDTQVTVQAAGISGPEGRQVVGQRWIDAHWSLPPTQAERAGTQATLTTALFRHSDSQALPGYRVRYRILDGPPALFTPGQAGEAVATTDKVGRATVGLVQSRPGLGTNRISVEVFRPPDWSGTDLTGSLVGQGETTVEWQAAALALDETLPPTVVVGREASCVLTVSNGGQLPARFVTVRAARMDGMEYVRSNPAAIVDGSQLVWTLDQLAGQGKRSLEVIYKPSRTGLCSGRALATAGDGLREEKTFQTQVLPEPQVRLRVEHNGPMTGLVLHGNGNAQGVMLKYELTVSNQGTAPANNVRLRMELDPALEHESGANPVEWALENLTPGMRRSVVVTLRPDRAGRAVNRLTVLADNKVVGQGDQVITIQEAGVNLTLTGPQTRYVGKPVAWDLVVTNTGETALSQVVVSDVLPPEMTFEKASDGGRAQGQTVVWALDQLKPKEVRKLQVTATANRMSPRAVSQAQVTAGSSASPAGRQQGLRAQAEAAIALQGVPAFKLKLAGRGPIEVGEPTSYTIDVINQGTLAGTGIQVVGILPSQMRLVSAGPGPFRVEGAKVIFVPVATLPVGQMLRYVLNVQGSKPGDARFRAELTSASLKQPLAKENSIAVHAVEAPMPPANQPPPVSP